MIFDLMCRGWPTNNCNF